MGGGADAVAEEASRWTVLAELGTRIDALGPSRTRGHRHREDCDETTQYPAPGGPAAEGPGNCTEGTELARPCCLLPPFVLGEGHELPAMPDRPRGTSYSDDNDGVQAHQALSRPCLATSLPPTQVSAGRDAALGRPGPLAPLSRIGDDAGS